MRPSTARKAKNLSLAALAALAGFVSVIIIVVALFIGLWLDALLDQNGLFTVGLLILSIPVSLYTMLKIVMGSVARIIAFTSPHKQDKSVPDVEEDLH